MTSSKLLAITLVDAPTSWHAPPCRNERLRLYQHWADTLAIEWGSDINYLVTALEEEQKKLKELYDRAALQVGGPPL